MTCTRHVLLVLLLWQGAEVIGAQAFKPIVPKVWDDPEMESFELPLATPSASPKHVSSEYYYRIPIRKIYRTYPPAGPGQNFEEYAGRIRQMEPELVDFDTSKFKTKEDWIRAGKAVFEAPASLIPDGVKQNSFLSRYVVRQKGHLDQGNFSCANCHTRRLSDGTLIPGAQEFFTQEYVLQNLPIRTPPREVVERARIRTRQFFATPWLNPDPNTAFVSDEEFIDLNRFRAGTRPRMGTSLHSQVQIPDLIGIKDRKYLDHTGMVQHRSIADLMRYAATNQGEGHMQALSRYGAFLPMGELPDPNTLERFSDEQLYAVALYIYSLEPPPNPNRFDALASQGQKVFTREGCANCHTPPLYTNNQLTPAEGFVVPEEHRRQYDIMPVVVGTDPYLTLRTRRGTGYYKVPSLKGVWYRGPFGHDGAIATLEDWFDPRRLRDDYTPTGYRPFGGSTRAVKGHNFGLALSTEEKRALIAFLKTL